MWIVLFRIQLLRYNAIFPPKSNIFDVSKAFHCDRQAFHFSMQQIFDQSFSPLSVLRSAQINNDGGVLKYRVYTVK